MRIPEFLLVVGLGCFIWAAWKQSVRWTAVGLACWVAATLIHGEILLPGG